jgi:hypothetical protein
LLHIYISCISFTHTLPAFLFGVIVAQPTPILPRTRRPWRPPILALPNAPTPTPPPPPPPPSPPHPAPRAVPHPTFVCQAATASPPNLHRSPRTLDQSWPTHLPIAGGVVNRQAHKRPATNLSVFTFTADSQPQHTSALDSVCCFSSLHITPSTRHPSYRPLPPITHPLSTSVHGPCW